MLHFVTRAAAISQEDCDSVQIHPEPSRHGVQRKFWRVPERQSQRAARSQSRPQLAALARIGYHGSQFIRPPIWPVAGSCQSSICHAFASKCHHVVTLCNYRCDTLPCRHAGVSFATIVAKLPGRHQGPPLRGRGRRIHFVRNCAPFRTSNQVVGIQTSALVWVKV